MQRRAGTRSADALRRRIGLRAAVELRQASSSRPARPCAPRRSRGRSRGSVLTRAGTAAAPRCAPVGRSTVSGQPHVRRVGVQRPGVPGALDRRERVARLERVLAPPPGWRTAGTRRPAAPRWSAGTTPASSSGLSPVDDRAAEVALEALDRVGDAGRPPSGSAMSVRGEAAEVVLAEVVGQDQAVLEEARDRSRRTHSAVGVAVEPVVSPPTASLIPGRPWYCAVSPAWTSLPPSLR